MLVLSRHRDEGIRIGDIKVIVVEIRGDKVRLGIDAPKDTPVHREEVYQAIRAGSPDIKAVPPGNPSLNKCWRCGAANEFTSDSSSTPAQRGEPIICGGCGQQYIG